MPVKSTAITGFYQTFSLFLYIRFWVPNMILLECKYLTDYFTMETMLIKDLKLLFRMGVLKKATIVPVPMQNPKRWHILFTIREEKRNKLVGLLSKRNEVREFSRIDSAMTEIRQVGLFTATIEDSPDY